MKKYGVWTQRIDQQIVPLLDGMLRHYNRRVKLFLAAQGFMDSVTNQQSEYSYKNNYINPASRSLRLLAPRNRDPRTYNLPAQDEVAVILPGEVLAQSNVVQHVLPGPAT
ncbi:BQ5605_C003g02510 [Microbotryum silenes-dioicae]|uniref:BQ5605_C003g02510 protein n=1 Tax=Microbotryum silenes-dioicae TaxID=796604 RepID=A0A2X0P4F8_9BASI|nr:BQ5605_C003g02510 [Microbotryum silenes-dioicae]